MTFARHLTFLLGAAALATLTACAPNSVPPDSTLGMHLGTSLDTFPGITDGRYTLSLTQDDREGGLPRPANQVAPTETGWTIVAICADTPTIDPAQTQNVILRVVSTALLDDQALQHIRSGSMQDGVVCGNAASIGPNV